MIIIFALVVLSVMIGIGLAGLAVGQIQTQNTTSSCTGIIGGGKGYHMVAPYVCCPIGTKLIQFLCIPNKPQSTENCTRMTQTVAADKRSTNLNSFEVFLAGITQEAYNIECHGNGTALANQTHITK